tara:strand:- start:695 stop:910 length:216 start_codon:yes stop_codon:yes gene_type:complete
MSEEEELKSVTNDKIKKGFDAVAKEDIICKSMGVHGKPLNISSRALKRRRERKDAKLARRAKKQANRKRGK